MAGLAWFLSGTISSLRDRALDDAFITFTYARNVAEGNGIRFNESDPKPTDGASSTLHLAVAAAGIRLGLDPLVSTRAISLLLFLAIPLTLAPVVARVASVPLGVGLLSSVAACTPLALMPETGWHLAAGMDTMLFAFLQIAALAWGTSIAALPSRPTLVSTIVGLVLLSLLALARPEGPALAAALLIAVAMVRATRPAHDVDDAASGLTIVAIAFTAIVGTMLALKVWYFGHLLPNAYYVKSSSGIFGSSGSLLPGAWLVTKFLVMRYVPLAIGVGVWAALLGIRGHVRRAALVLLLPSAAFVLLYARAIHEAAGSYRYEYPYILPLFGCLALLLALQWKQSRVAYGLILLFGASLAPAFVPQELLEDALRAPWETASGWIRHKYVGGGQAALGRDLGETGLQQAGTILLSGAGQVPYFSRFNAIDWVGLNTSELSGREARTIDQVWEYIDARRPDVIYSFLPPAAPGVDDRLSDPGFLSPAVQLTLQGRGSELLRHWNRARVEDMFYREMTYLRDHYEFGTAYRLVANDWALMAYIRRDSPRREAIERAFQRSTGADGTLDLTEFYRVDPRALR